MIRAYSNMSAFTIKIVAIGCIHCIAGVLLYQPAFHRSELCLLHFSYLHNSNCCGSAVQYPRIVQSREDSRRWRDGWPKSRSADFQSAVSQNCILRTVRMYSRPTPAKRPADYKSATQQIENLRYFGLRLCRAEPLRLCVESEIRS